MHSQTAQFYIHINYGRKKNLSNSDHITDDDETKTKNGRTFLHSFISVKH